MIAYYHGGGWVIATIDTYDASAAALAEKAKAIVVSVEYRHAPENKFPAAHDDSFAAYKWVLQNARDWGGDPRKVAVAGESAGGNLAINMAMMARDQNVQQPVHMLLVYPVAGTDMNTPSYKENAEAMPLSKQAMEWFVKNTVNSEQDLQDPRLDVVGKANLKDLPDATVITAEIDPLMSEGRMLAQKLRQAGSEVKYQNFDGPRTNSSAWLPR
jgi:acetyl esterase/lipase